MSQRFKAKCPCCDRTLLVDADRKRLVALQASGGDSSLAAALEDLAQDEDRRSGLLQSALDDESKDKPKLEDLL